MRYTNGRVYFTYFYFTKNECIDELIRRFVPIHGSQHTSPYGTRPQCLRLLGSTICLCVC